MMKRAIVLLILIVVPSVWAHPHIWIDGWYKVHYENDQLNGVEIFWLMDEMFSSAIILDYDKDRNGQFSKAESAEIEQKAFKNVGRWNYYTHIEIDGKGIGEINPQQFSAKIEKQQRILYRFFVPVNKKIKKSTKLKVASYDPTYYTDINIQTSKVREKGYASFRRQLGWKKMLHRTEGWGDIHHQEAVFTLWLK